MYLLENIVVGIFLNIRYGESSLNTSASLVAQLVKNLPVMQETLV